ncbi:MAG: ABC-F family ATP-binding cassette domain-containing protein [Bacteroides sp.]|nr:ABC-F family ATP-binding cassette domain-containing protein [Prevotella sp.]MCM1408593.1 ABC-F family ATP-binding cassette domain-containing protein [Treponema brennaborense]MCM1468919.1 ABC-F family ATP-binding cassette domain-containing protein [Bacteroides sp.]
MAFVQFSRVSLAFGDRDILKDVSVNLAAGTKAALTGGNGAGKSTLMKVMAGLIECDSGERAVQKNCRIAYLPQSGIVHRGTTVRSEADRAFARGYALHEKLEQIGAELAEGGLAAGRQTQLLEQHHAVQQQLEDSLWHRRNVFAEQVLAGLGFAPSDFDRPVEEFSGGWQMRIALAKVLLEKPDILLLDEPTNYLDIEARTWLEQFLSDFSGGFLLVSHDRYFLDTVVREVYELFNGALRRYPGNYSHYESVRAVELESLTARYEQQQQEIRKLEDFIRRFGAKATKAAQAQERQKMLDKIERIEIPESFKKIHFSFPPAPHSGRLVITAENLGKTYRSADGTQNEVIKNLDLVVEKGTRLAAAGRNGAGKSTLLKILAGVDTEFGGTLKYGAGVSVGWFSQDHAEQMNGSRTILEEIEREAPLELIPKIRDMLGAFLFRGDDVYKQIQMLSGGEKSRLALLRLLLKPVNLLVLDEPTNHLDLHSKDVLLNALREFTGTVIFVSHDRGFIESLATQVLELRPASARLFPGGYQYYQDRLAAEANAESAETRAGSQKTADKTPPRGMPDKSAETEKRPLSWEEGKRLRAARRKLEHEEERLLNVISEAEAKKAQLEQKLADPAVYSDGAACRQVQKELKETETAIENFTAEWEAVSAQLESC